MKKQGMSWLGPVLMVLAAVVCVLIAQWYSTRVVDDGSPVSFREYEAATQEAYESIGLPPWDYQAKYWKISRTIPFYCTPELLEEEVAAIQNYGQTGQPPVSFEEFRAACEAVYAAHGVDGWVEEPEGGFYCTPVLMEQSLRYLDLALSGGFDEWTAEKMQSVELLSQTA